MNKGISIVILLFCLPAIIYAQSKSDIREQRQLKKLEAKNNINEYCSFQKKIPLPTWYEDTKVIMDELQPKYFIKNPSINNIIIAAGSTNSTKEGNAIENARKNAWANIRKQFYDSYIDEFTANSSTSGSNNHSKVDTGSFYSFISEGITGISPITPLKATFHYDTCTNKIDCYMLAYVNKPEFDRRMKEIKEKQKVAKQNKELEKQIIDLAQRGYEAEKDLNIGIALRNFYWSQTLCNKHPNPSAIEHSFNYRDTINLTYCLNKQIREIFNSITFEVIEVSSSDNEGWNSVKVKALYNGIKLQNLRIRYDKSNDYYSRIQPTNNGFFNMEIKQAFNETAIKIEYKYKDELNTRTDEQASLLLSLKGNDYDKINTKVIPFKVTNKDKKPETEELQKPENVFIANSNILIDKIINKDLSLDTSFFSEQGYASFKKMVSYGNAQIYFVNPHLEEPMQHDNKVMVRSIPMNFSFKNKYNLNEPIVINENIVIHFDAKTKKVSNITFALQKHVTDEVLKYLPVYWPDALKFELFSFIEAYQTAYAFKDTNYIKKVFADEALIISGGKISAKPQSIEQNVTLAVDDGYVLRQRTKEEYIKHLRHVWKNNDFINLSFENVRFKPHKTIHDIYGIYLFQYYNSENYSDEGHLFLSVDYRDKMNPQINIRTWHPNKPIDWDVINNFSTKYVKNR
ncbi:MAG: hypothetical protein JEZ09_07855 [Salinivirgaceae bacterium]|nr:hypothetical protein [Salinivirgaceae bacterium]